MSAMDHIRFLAETIGPRGSTTKNEAEAADYAARVLSGMGLDPVRESFTSAVSAWYPYALSNELLLVAAACFWVGGRWGAIAALIVALLALVSVILELLFRPNPLRWMLPKGKSQNVWARIEPSEQAVTNLVLTAHLDSHRTPMVFSTDLWLRVFQTLVPLGLLSTVLMVILFVVGVFAPSGAVKILVALPAAVSLGILLLTLQADQTRFTPGANDNASGAGVALSLARRLADAPLRSVRAWVVLTGCEEVGCYGAEAFAAAHGAELGAAIWITLDSVGGLTADPVYLRKETFLLTSASDPRLLAHADHIARERPELAAHPRDFAGAYTEGAIAARHGFRVLTLMALPRHGPLPGWHRPTDTLEGVDPNVVHRTEEFAWEIIQRIDREAGEQSTGS
jgi:hypothetical protein